MNNAQDDALTKSSNPRSVPVNSRSFFMITQIFEPIHLSMSSLSRQALNLLSEMKISGMRAPNGRTWEAMVADRRHQENGDFLIYPYKWLKLVVKARNRCKSQVRLTKLCLTGPVAEIWT